MKKISKKFSLHIPDVNLGTPRVFSIPLPVTTTGRRSTRILSLPLFVVLRINLPSQWTVSLMFSALNFAINTSSTFEFIIARFLSRCNRVVLLATTAFFTFSFPARAIEAKNCTESLSDIFNLQQKITHDKNSLEILLYDIVCQELIFILMTNSGVQNKSRKR